MSKVTIIVNAQVEGGNISRKSPVTERMASALAKSITQSGKNFQVEIIGGAELWSKSIQLPPASPEYIYCPLTIKLPDWFDFPARQVYAACRDLEARRKWVEAKFGYQTSKDNCWLGDLWLPIIMTEEKLIYGSIIAEGVIPNDYRYPYTLPSPILKKLHRLANDLLDSIGAIPSVYLLQFRLMGEDIIFDRLWPFPATPAIASIHIQQPDLFACHWYCLSRQPIKEILYPTLAAGKT
ncbi:MAG: hypothetical protein NZ901_01320 [Geminocystis sp.]|nr:hypothetical protein [Geminocystis sp.]HIK36728.1 hypothetical protein [Geminocystis sp. M7585_C2015_104]MCS7146808.1 hypothetical protein [Geminocystis sp.]MCX8077042.1 hypothetical protein [Geminocystis sp.]MDW8115634.1 hypothetical protein [Geminocystis sp.]